MDGSAALEGLTAMKQQLQKYTGTFAKVWLALKVLLILVGLVAAVIYATNTTRIAAIENVTNNFSQVSAAQGHLLSKTEAIISDVYRTNTLPEADELYSVRESASNVLAALSGFSAPNRSIRQERDEYRRALERLMGSINAYSESIESYQAVQNASVMVVSAGGDFRDAVERFTGSTWYSFWGVW